MQQKSPASGMAMASPNGLDPAIALTLPRPRGLAASDLFEIVLAHLWKGVAVGLLAGGAVTYSLMSAQPIYEARDLLVYQLGRDFVYVPDTVVNGVRPPDPGNLQPFVNAEMQILDSSGVRESLLDRLLEAGVYKLSADYDRDALLTRLDKAISISLITGSFIIDVRVRDTKPDRGAAIAQALIAAYMDGRVDMVAIDPPKFLTTHIADAEVRRDDLDGQIEALTGFRDLAAYDQSLTAANAQKARTSQDLIAVRTEVTGLQAKAAAYLEAVMALPAAERVAGKPTYDKLDASLTSAKVDLAGATARATAIEAEDARQTAYLADQAGKAAEVARLRGLRDAAQTQLAQLQTRQLDTDLTLQRMKAGAGAVRVLEQGVVNNVPIGLPDRVKQISGIMVGLVAAALAIVLSELNAARLYTADIALSRLGLPVLGEVEERRRLFGWLRRKGAV